jgi:hypothetical protein
MCGAETARPRSIEFVDAALGARFECMRRYRRILVSQARTVLFSKRWELEAHACSLDLMGMSPL